MSKRKQPQQQYYNIRSLLSKNAIYNIIIGERSNGKTYAVLKYGVEQYQGQITVCHLAPLARRYNRTPGGADVYKPDCER